MDIEQLKEVLDVLGTTAGVQANLKQLRDATKKHDTALRELNLAKDAQALMAEAVKLKGQIEDEAHGHIAKAKAEANTLAGIALERETTSKEVELTLRGLRTRLEGEERDLVRREKALTTGNATLERQRELLSVRETELEKADASLKSRVLAADSVLKGLASAD